VAATRLTATWQSIAASDRFSPLYKKNIVAAVSATLGKSKIIVFAW